MGNTYNPYLQKMKVNTKQQVITWIKATLLYEREDFTSVKTATFLCIL